MFDLLKEEVLAHSVRAFIVSPYRLQRILIRSLDGVDLSEKHAHILFFRHASLMPKQKSPVICEIAIGIHVDFTSFCFGYFSSSNSKCLVAIALFSLVKCRKLAPNPPGV